MYSSSLSPSSTPEPLPNLNNYKILKILGEGGFGKVLKCARQETEDTVAIKIGKKYSDLRREAFMLKTLMQHNLAEFNIIKFYGEVIIDDRISLMLEVLDISLIDYLFSLDRPMQLRDIRTVIQQLATALDALKKIGVIHTDVKLENIMMVDHVRQPFRVKLIDFGLAIFRSQGRQCRVHQTPYYRAPEIILGLPFSEAIDIWSLGCVMAAMMFCVLLFPANTEYELLRYIMDLLGPLPDHLLDAGYHTKRFFNKTDSDHWMFKTCEEVWGPIAPVENRRYTFRSLDKKKKIPLEKFKKTRANEKKECIELLKEMLNLDGNQRITPSGILNHPFITQSCLNTSSHLSSCDKPLESAADQPSTSHAQTTTKQTKEETKGDDSPHPAAAPSNTMDPTRMHSDDMDLSPSTPDDDEDKKKKKKKRRNCFTRFFSWMRKKIFTS